MASWYFLSLGDAMMANESLERIRDAFLQRFESHGKPSDMAIFTRTDSIDHLHCEVFAYFSPASSDVAKQFDAMPCEQPLKTGLELLAGNSNSLIFLFSEDGKDA